MISAKEAGFLLLTSKLGNPDRPVLTTAQLRTLGQRMQNMERPSEDRDVTAEDLMGLGYSRDSARRILHLLEETDVLEHYLRRAERMGCIPISRVNPGYPGILKDKLGLEAPGCLWMKGDLSILDTPMIALVGSRDIAPENKAFAAEVGRQAALQGYTLVSGNARGADRTAQSACLKAGGRVVSVVADSLAQKTLQSRVLYVSEEDFDGEFSAQRALRRNRIIHTLGSKTFVAQSGFGYGGTWDGTQKNLQNGWSPVFCFRDGSDGSVQLSQLGANLIRMEDLRDLAALEASQKSLFA